MVSAAVSLVVSELARDVRRHGDDADHPYSCYDEAGPSLPEGPRSMVRVAGGATVLTALSGGGVSYYRTAKQSSTILEYLGHMVVFSNTPNHLTYPQYFKNEDKET